MDQPTIATAPATAATSPNLDETTVCLVLDFHRFGIRRKVDSREVETDADRALLAVSKCILASEEYDRIVSHDGETRNWIERRALPSLLKRGIWRLPVTLIEQTDAYLSQRLEQRQVLIAELRACYPARVAETQARLGSLGNDGLPGADAFCARFTMSWRYISYGTPGKLQCVAPALFAREREKAAIQWAEATQEIRAVLRESLAELVSHLAEKLSGGRDNGKPKIFRDSAVTNLTEFLDLFQARNVTDDTALADLVTRCRALVAGRNPQQLRDSAMVRASVAANLTEIKTALDTLLTDRPGRRISFEDDNA